MHPPSDVARVRGPDEQETYIIAFGVIPSSRAGRFRDARAGFGLTLIAGIRNSRISATGTRFQPLIGFPQLGNCTAISGSFELDTHNDLAGESLAWLRRSIRAQREALCVICRDGPCSASIRSVKPADIGYAPMPHRRSIAAIAANRFAMCRRPSVRSSG